ncbi:MAG: DUF4248 domain-containing protein [Mediterranea massiliensis]|nr:DUF4248 domain-containing protein [Mediterranea massiliensis]
MYFAELAMHYFPNSNQKSAVQQLRRWIDNDVELSEELKRLYFMPRQRALTPKQYNAIIEHLGNPFN